MNETLILYMLILWAFVVMARRSMKFSTSYVMSIIVANLVELDTIKYFDSMLFIGVYEIVIASFSYIILKLTYNMSKMNFTLLLYIVELLVSVGLVMAYYYLGNMILKI